MFSVLETMVMWFVATPAPAALRRTSLTGVEPAARPDVVTLTDFDESPAVQSMRCVSSLPLGYVTTSEFVETTTTDAAFVRTTGTSTQSVTPTSASRRSLSVSPTPNTPPVYFGTTGAGVYL